MERAYPMRENPADAQSGMNTGSAFDCTGLIPSMTNDDEYESYTELYDFLPPDPKNIKR